jgi:phosphoribosyl-AMP cyclohydrolase
MKIIDQVKWDSNKLVPVILQDSLSNKILMMAWMNKEALVKSIEENKCYFYSRSRKKLWLKGEESGHVHHVKDIFLDCDGDTILMKVVVEEKISCHTGRNTCFFHQVSNQGNELNIVEDILKDPELIYKKGDV